MPDTLLADLATHGQVLDVIPEVSAVMLRASASELAPIRALPYVAAANADAPRFLAGGDPVPVPDFADGADQWSLDAVNVTDFGVGRTLAYDGAGVYVAVFDTGLVHNWREYFPEERVVFATEFLADALVTTNIRSLPSACGPYDGTPLAEWLKSYRTVEALDFDVLAAGHGTGLFRKADVAMTREFFEDLIAAVTAGMQQGRSLEEMERTILLEKYKDWAQYDRLRVYNIRSAYQNLKTYR